MWHLISLAFLLVVSALPGRAIGQDNGCGDVNDDGSVNFIDARMILLGQPLSCAGPTCGDGMIDPDEDCDEGNLGGATCETYGLPFGQLTCGLGCVHDLSGCHAERFHDNGDGTITDWQTVLMWEKKDDSGGVHDVDNRYQWSDDSDDDWTDPDGMAFVVFLGELNNCVYDDTPPSSGVTGGFAGYCDWRLPGILELQTLLLEPEPCGTSPCVHPIFEPTASYSYWSSTTLEGLATAAWQVDFGDGGADPTFKPHDFHVRAVRDGP